MDQFFDSPVPVLGNLALARAHYDVTELRLQAPAVGSNNSIHLTLTLHDLEVDLDRTLPDGTHFSFFAVMEEVLVDCTLKFGAPLAGQCGEVPVFCSSAAVDVVNFRHNLPYPLTEEHMQQGLAVLLSGGIRLHFEGFQPTNLTVTSNGGLTLTGNRNDGCSSIPAPLPTMGPLRGLVQTQTVAGKGYFLGSKGSVIPFDVFPELKLDWFPGNQLIPSFQPWTVVQPGAKIFAGELARPLARLPDRMHASVELVRHVQRNCWLKPTGITTLLQPLFPKGLSQNQPVPCGDECGCITCSGSKFFLELIGADGTSVVTRDISILPSGDRVTIEAASSADLLRDVAPRLARLDGELCPGPNCPDRCSPGRCSPWVRLDLVENAYPPLPGSPGAGGPPWHVVLWAGRSLEALDREIGISPQCPLTPGGPGTGETIVGSVYTEAASIVFGRMMVDSAVFPSGPQDHVSLDGSRFHTGFFEESESGSAFGRALVPTPSGTGLKIEPMGGCEPHEVGAVHGSVPCWQADFLLPQAGSIKIARGYSETTVPFVSVPTILDATGVASTLGSRSRAVHGTLDRSGIEIYTRVPNIYNDIGLTDAVYDFRGIREADMVAAMNPNVHRLPPDGVAYLDWQHDPGALPLPYTGASFGHPDPNQTDWLNSSHFSTYFADWRSDRLLLKWRIAQPFSYCPRLEQLYASPREFVFWGAGVGGNPISLPAAEVLDTGVRGPAPDFNFQIAPQSSARGGFQRVLPP